MLLLLAECIPDDDIPFDDCGHDNLDPVEPTQNNESITQNPNAMEPTPNDNATTETTPNIVSPPSSDVVSNDNLVDTSTNSNKRSNSTATSSNPKKSKNSNIHDKADKTTKVEMIKLKGFDSQYKHPSVRPFPETATMFDCCML